MRRTLNGLIGLFAGLTTSVVLAQTQQQTVLLPSSTSGQFGTAVALSDDFAAVGSLVGDTVATFVRNAAAPDGWSPAGTVSLDCQNAAFGRALAMQDDLLIVGASRDDCSGPFEGSVSIYQRDEADANGWSLIQRQPQTSVDGVDDFGATVALAGDVLVVSGQSEPGSDVPAVFVYERNQGGPSAWGLVTRLLPSSPTYDTFGEAIAVGDGMIAVGAQAERAVDIFARDVNGDWSYSVTLVPDVMVNGFGTAIAFNGERLVVTGTAITRVYERVAPGQWILTASFRSDEQGGLSASAVQWAGDFILAAEIGSDGVVPNSGAAFLFAPNEVNPGLLGWSQDEKFFADDGLNAARFGRSLAVRGSTLLVGAPFHRPGNSIDGRAYIFELDLAQDYCDLSATPPADFGEQPVGELVSQPLTLQNVGNAACTIESIEITTSNSDYALSDLPAFPAMLAPGEAVTVSVDYSRTKLDRSDATLTIVSDDALSPTMIELTANSTVLTCSLSAIFESGAFYDDVPISDSVTLNLLLLNKGDEACVVSSAPVSGDPAFELVDTVFPLTVIREDDRIVPLRYTPSEVGESVSTFSFFSNDGLSPFQFNVTGNGVNLCNLQLSEDAFDFGLVALDSSASDSVLLTRQTNPDAPSLCVIQTASLGNAAPFAVSAGVAGAMLGGGDELLVTVDLDTAAPGSFNDVLTLTTNDPAQPTLSFPVSAQIINDTDADGVDDSVDNCVLGANPSQLDTDGDGFGNLCDQDLNNDCVVNAVDLGIFRTLFFGSGNAGDFNGDGVTASVDLGILRQNFFGVPGPSAQASCDE